jgi:SAGA-associated factor 73
MDSSSNGGGGGGGSSGGAGAGDDPTQPGKKRAKYAPSVNGKGRFKGPVDYDKHCGVINDKGLPCTRSLTCKSHSMGAKRAIVGRSRAFDELLRDWYRANNPNYVEPVKRETKAERKEKAEREKAEKLRLAREAAAAAGIDLDAEKKAKKKKIKAATAGAANGAGGVGADGSGAGGSAGGGSGGGGTGGAAVLGPDGQPIAGDVKKKKKINAKKAATAADKTGADAEENLNDIDSDVEVETLAKTVATARERGSVALPLAVPCDTSSWFVARRERLRNCRDLLATALGVPASTGWNAKPAVIGGMKI